MTLLFNFAEIQKDPRMGDSRESLAFLASPGISKDVRREHPLGVMSSYIAQSIAVRSG
jgi:hypothetical protein